MGGAGMQGTGFLSAAPGRAVRDHRPAELRAGERRLRRAPGASNHGLVIQGGKPSKQSHKKGVVPVVQEKNGPISGATPILR